MPCVLFWAISPYIHRTPAVSGADLIGLTSWCCQPETPRKEEQGKSPQKAHPNRFLEARPPSVSFLVVLVKKQMGSPGFTWWLKIIYQGNPSIFPKGTPLAASDFFLPSSGSECRGAPGASGQLRRWRVRRTSSCSWRTRSRSEELHGRCRGGVL